MTSAEGPHPEGDNALDPGNMDIRTLRDAIDEIDVQILELVNRRLLIARRIGELKQRSGLPVEDRLREREVLQRLQKQNKGPLAPDALNSLFRVLMAAGRGIQRT